MKRFIKPEMKLIKLVGENLIYTSGCNTQVCSNYECPGCFPGCSAQVCMEVICTDYQE